MSSILNHILCVLGLCTSALYAAATDADFGIRVIGGGSLCTGEETTARVAIDLNRTGQNGAPVRGFTIAICHVPYQLDVVATARGTGFAVGTGVPCDFFLISEQPRGVTLAVVVDLTENRGVPAVNDFHALSITYKVLDAADPAPITPCDRAVGFPPVVLMFSTGQDSFYPLEENLIGAEIESPCSPVERTFRLSARASEPLRVDADTGTGSTTLELSLQEDAVACCPPRLLQGLTLGIDLPDDLRLVRFLPGDVYTLGFVEHEGSGCGEIEATFAASTRFGIKTTVLRVEVATRPESWRGVLAAATRDVRFVDRCANASSVKYLDGRRVPFADLAAATLALSVQPRRPFFLRGDVNADGTRNIADAIRLLTWLYRDHALLPPCLDAADSNDDGRVDIADGISILTRIFGVGGGGAFPEPWRQCGRDPTSDTLDCRDFPACAR